MHLVPKKTYKSKWLLPKFCEQDRIYNNGKPYLLNMTENKWCNTTMTILNVWIWQKLKPTNLNHKGWSVISSKVLLTSLPDIFFFLSMSETKGLARLGRCDSQCKLARRGWATCPIHCVSLINHGLLTNWTLLVNFFFLSWYFS